jgi:hypothetical protein
MLTDDEIRKLMETMRDTIAGDTIHELCTRLLDAEAMVKHGDIKDTADYLVEALEQQEKEALQARVKVLEDALRPFGRFADSYDPAVTVRHHGDDEEIYVREMNAIGKRAITVGDCRTARNALQEQSK